MFLHGSKMLSQAPPSTIKIFVLASNAICFKEINVDIFFKTYIITVLLVMKAHCLNNDPP